MCSLFFFFNDTATTEIYTLSLHDALPILARKEMPRLFTRFGRIVTLENGAIPGVGLGLYLCRELAHMHGGEDRKSTRLNSSHSQISYAVFCLKKKRIIEVREMTTNKFTWF